MDVTLSVKRKINSLTTRCPGTAKTQATCFFTRRTVVCKQPTYALWQFSPIGVGTTIRCGTSSSTTHTVQEDIYHHQSPIHQCNHYWTIEMAQQFVWVHPPSSASHMSY